MSDIGIFKIKEAQCVYIFKINLKPEEFGLRNSKNENKEYKTNRKMKQTIRLNETDLHRLIKESVKQVLSERKSRLIKEDLESDVKDEERKSNAYTFMALKRLSYLIHEEMRPLLSNKTPELLEIYKEMVSIVDDAIGTNKDAYKYSPIPSRSQFFQEH